MIVRFGPFELDSSTGELRKHGLKIRLQGQRIKILALLLARPGVIVTREELQRTLWPDNTFVDFENSLNAAVKRCRHPITTMLQKCLFGGTRKIIVRAPVEFSGHRRCYGNQGGLTMKLTSSAQSAVVFQDFVPSPSLAI